MSEHPKTVHGRLMESAHISGYSFERACSELESLLEDDRWKELGFETGGEFYDSIMGLFKPFRMSVEQRKPLAQKLSKIGSQRAVAGVLGVDHKTISNDLRDGENSPEKEYDSTDFQGPEQGGGENSPSEWYQDTDPAGLAREQAKKEEKKRQREEQNAALSAESRPFPEGKFAVIYADPPWQFDVWSDEGKDRAAENHYPIQTLDEIKAWSVIDIAADDCALFMWAVMPQLPEALEVINAWGFEYKTCAFTWVKTTKDGSRPATGMGYWTRANAEICLLATRGSPKRVNADVPQVIMSPRTEHSRKPDEVAERIERLVTGPYVELFARRPRDGWETWGNQA